MNSQAPDPPRPHTARVKRRAARRLFNRWLTTAQARGTFFFVIFALIGVIGGLVGAFFRLVLTGLRSVAFQSNEGLFDAAKSLPWHWVVLIPAAGGLVAGLIIHFALKGQRGAGVAEIMEAVALRDRKVGLRSSIWKSLAALSLMGTGGSVGREGPIAQVSAAVSSKISRFLGLSAERRNILLGCGVAAGMAATYNAPLGATFFVMDIIFANYAMDVFGPVVVAALSASLVTRALVGPNPIYDIPEFQSPDAWEYIFFALLGVAAALAGRLFILVLDRSSKYCGRIPAPLYVKTLIGGVGIGIIGIWLPQVWGNGYEGVSLALTGGLAIWMLAACFMAKILATSLTLGSGGLGGVMTPTLFIGAALGGLIGTGIHTLLPGMIQEPNSYALVGMAGLLAATTHAPIMATFITFEMSGNYAMILPLGLCAAVAALTSRWLGSNSIYTERLRKRGLDLDAVIEESALHAIRVEDVMRRDIPVVRPEVPLRVLLDRFLHAHRNLVHVVDPPGNYLGLIDLQDVVAATEDPSLRDVLVAVDLTRQVPAVLPGDPVAAVMERFWFQEYGELPVLSDQGERFLGVVTRRDVLGAFDREVLRRKVLTVRYRQGKGIQEKQLPLLGDFGIEEIAVPPAAIGKTLAEIDLPRRFHLNALAIHRPGKKGMEELIPPPADLELAAGDRLVLLGPRDNLKSFVEQKMSS